MSGERWGLIVGGCVGVVLGIWLSIWAVFFTVAQVAP